VGEKGVSRAGDDALRPLFCDKFSQPSLSEIPLQDLDATLPVRIKKNEAQEEKQPPLLTRLPQLSKGGMEVSSTFPCSFPQTTTMAKRANDDSVSLLS